MAKKPTKEQLEQDISVKVNEMRIEEGKQPVWKPRGRPKFNWTEEMEEVLFEGIVCGKAVRQIVAEEGEGFPSADTIYRRISSDPQFCDKYTRAKGLQADIYLEDSIAIADGHHPDFVDKTLEEKKFAVEQRKWTMGKLQPKKYNDKIIAEITGKDGSPLVPTQRIDVNSMSDEARESLKFALLTLSSRANAEDIYEEDEDE